MTAYIIRRLLYAIPILLGINILVFGLFFIVNTPDDMARAHLGTKYTTPEQVDAWKRKHNLDMPMFYNPGWKRVAAGTSAEIATLELPGPGQYRAIIDKEIIGFADSAPEFPEAERIVLERFDPLPLSKALTETIFFKRSLKMLVFDYGKTEKGGDIRSEIMVRMAPSLFITLPALFIGAFINILLAMMMAANRGNYVDTGATITCVILISISSLFYIIGGQWIFGWVLKIVPISGFDFDSFSLRFLILPVAIIVVAGLGATTRFYRTLFLEEMNRQYVQTARAKGIAETRVFFVHVLKNAMIPILTGLVVQLPLLFLGSLLIENFFSIPGMGAYTVQAIQGQEFATVQAMVSLGSFMYIIGLLITDISYVLVDPRVRLES
ncbi:MAG: peptide/nickel transport system permease protein [Rhodothermales bacterium]|jgi:peptide/nickel transport system permease protein